MSENRNFAKVIDGGKALEYAPELFWPNPNPPSEAECNERGYYRVAPDKPLPAPSEGKHWEFDRYTVEDGLTVKKYKEVDDPPPPPRVFETADLVEALMEEGVWEAARAWIVERGILDLVLATKEFDELNQNFQSGKTALQAELGWTDDDVEELLERCKKGA